MANERKFIGENIKRMLVKEYVMGQIERAGFGGIDIQRTPMGTRVTLYTERPGIVIGHKGEAIKKLTNDLKTKFNFDNPQIEVEEVKEPSLNAQIMAEKLASALERGWHFRRAGHSTVRRIMESGARGCEIILSGKLTGQRHRVEKFKEGHIKFCGEPKLQWMRRGFSVAKLKLGVIGVIVWIMDPNAKLPDEISLVGSLEKKEKPSDKKKDYKTDAGKGDDKKDVKKTAKEEKPEKPGQDKEVKKDEKKPAAKDEKKTEEKEAEVKKGKETPTADKADPKKETVSEPAKDDKAVEDKAAKAEPDTKDKETKKEVKSEEPAKGSTDSEESAGDAKNIKKSKDSEEPTKGGE
jgi:small subunit ribosomal protein S3